MKRKLNWLLTIGVSLTICKVNAQSPQPSPEIAKNFSKMFPGASNVDWKEKTTNFTAFFNLNDHKCEAKFAKSGEWLNTEEAIALDSLPRAIREGFTTSKYADWTVRAAYSITSSDGTIEYHIVAVSTDMSRKILFFSQEGKLLADR